MFDYVRKTESELDRLSDDELLAWVTKAREAGDIEQARNACGMLAFRHEDRVEAKIRIRTSPEHAEDIFMTVMESVVRSAFDGKFMGEFGSWINRITQRRIADFYKKRESSVKTTLLADEHDDEDGVWVSHGADDDDIVLIGYRDLAEQLRAARTKRIHRYVIELYGPVELGYLEFDAASTCAEIRRLTGETISEANVHQIWRRFKIDFMEALDEADIAGGGDS